MYSLSSQENPHDSSNKHFSNVLAASEYQYYGTWWRHLPRGLCGFSLERHFWITSSLHSFDATREEQGTPVCTLHQKKSQTRHNSTNITISTFSLAANYSTSFVATQKTHRPSLQVCWSMSHHPQTSSPTHPRRIIQ